MDAEMMEHVFYNLLLNAVQASEPGAAVAVKTRRLDHAAEICVIDHGCGIAPKTDSKPSSIPFFTTKPTGVGLGLPIVAKIVDEHGGKLRSRANRAREAPSASCSLCSHRMKQRILIVEDEEKLRRVIQLQLDSSRALKSSRRAPPKRRLLGVDRADLILTDLRLPGMSGLEMLALIQRQNSRAPVIMMTAHGTIENAVEAMKAGRVRFPAQALLARSPDDRGATRRSKCAACAMRTAS